MEVIKNKFMKKYFFISAILFFLTAISVNAQGQDVLLNNEIYGDFENGNDLIVNGWTSSSNNLSVLFSHNYFPQSSNLELEQGGINISTAGSTQFVIIKSDSGNYLRSNLITLNPVINEYQLEFKYLNLNQSSYENYTGRWKVNFINGSNNTVFDTFISNSIQNYKVNSIWISTTYELINVNTNSLIIEFIPISDDPNGFAYMAIDNIQLIDRNDDGNGNSTNEDPTDTTVTPTCVDCSSFNLVKNQKYVISGWTKLMNETGSNFTQISTQSYENVFIGVSFLDTSGALIGGSELQFFPTGEIIDGWQKIQGDITIPDSIDNIKISLVNNNTGNANAFFDDIRVHPYNGNLKSFVYDQATQKLMAELDENNYSTFYEYDKEGGLIRVKKETERGVFTIQETRSSTKKE